MNESFLTFFLFLKSSIMRDVINNLKVEAYKLTTK